MYNGFGAGTVRSKTSSSRDDSSGTKDAMTHVHVFEQRHEKTYILVFDQVRHKPGCTVTDNSATALFHRQPTHRHDHWPTRQVTDNCFKKSPTLADTNRQRLSLKKDEKFFFSSLFLETNISTLCFQYTNEPRHEKTNVVHMRKQRRRSQMSRVMRKPTLCICENKDADQPRGNREADQRLCFRYIDSTITLLSKSEISSL